MPRRSAASLSIVPPSGPSAVPREPEPAPEHLSDAAREWWSDVQAHFNLNPHRTMLLTTAAEAWDRKNQAADVLKAEGLTYDDKDGCPKRHPCVMVERLAGQDFARLVKQLGLDAKPPRIRNR